MKPEDLQLLVSRCWRTTSTGFAREGFREGEIGHLMARMREIGHNGLSILLAPLCKR